MVTEAIHAPIPPDTEVSSANWPDLRGRGLTHCVNISPARLDAGGNQEARRIRTILEWEAGKGNVFEGCPYRDGEPQESRPPGEFYGPENDTGLYVIPPEEGWTPHWVRAITSDHPEIIAAGIGHLLEVDPDDPDSWVSWTARWSIWAVYGSDDRFRCWGPVTDWSTKFEGTLAEVIAHIRAFETH